MNILIVLVPVSLFLGLVGLVAFAWTMRASQYDDTEGSRYRILDTRWDDDPNDQKQS